MGAVTFSLDMKLLYALKSSLRLDRFVETGTFRGDTVAQVAPYFDEVISIELSDELSKAAASRFASEPKIKILHGSSPTKLEDIRPDFQGESALFWLDAHWCVASNTAGLSSQCPLLDELRAIKSVNAESVILIDDARLFLAPPLAPHEISHWPNFDEIIRQLLAMSECHQIMVINDVIAFFPTASGPAIARYAQDYGTDWLLASNSLKQNGTIMNDLADKEKVIQDTINLVREQNKRIGEGKFYRDLYEALPRPLRFLARANLKLVQILRPRLGQLNQYAPRPLKGLTVVEQSTVARPKMSIVTPSFQQGDYIERTLRSVLDQGYLNLEYFVQDGGSQDDTLGILRSFDGQLSGWASEPDSGQSQAINRGFDRTTGEIMAWLNSDDILLPGAIAKIADFFNAHPDVDVVYGNRLMIDENDMEIGRWIMPGHDSAVLSWADYIPQETMFWRRTIWNKAGGKIDESFRFAMDWDLLIRFRDAGAKFAHIPEFLGGFRIHESQKTSAAINEIGYEEMNRIRQRVLGYVPAQGEIRRATIPFVLRHIIADIKFRFSRYLSKKTRKPM